MKNRILSVIFSLMLLVVSGSYTLAGNSGDTGFSFYFTRNISIKNIL